MKLKPIILGGLLLLVLFLSACTSSEKPQPQPPPPQEQSPTETNEKATDITCTSSQECPNDHSCYAELPLGPSAGIKGSPNNPGKCYSNEMIGQIY